MLLLMVGHVLYWFSMMFSKHCFVLETTKSFLCWSCLQLKSFLSLCNAGFAFVCYFLRAEFKHLAGICLPCKFQTCHLFFLFFFASFLSSLCVNKFFFCWTSGGWVSVLYVFVNNVSEFVLVLLTFNGFYLKDSQSCFLIMKKKIRIYS